MTKITSVQAYLEAEIMMLKMMRAPRHVGGYHSMSDFILKNGTEFTPIKRPRDVKRGIIKQCYKNCAEAVLFGSSDYIYCEGYAAGPIPVLHAWLSDGDGHAIDPTWKDGIEYFGVAINTDYLRNTALRTKHYGVIDNWQERWPILSDAPRLWRHPLWTYEKEHTPKGRQIITNADQEEDRQLEGTDIRRHGGAPRGNVAAC